MTDHPEIDHLAKEERIRSIAYAIWEEEGCPDGRDLEHWARACELVEAEAAADPEWLKRTESESPPVAEKAADETRKSSLDELVKSIKGSTRAA